MGKLYTFYGKDMIIYYPLRRTESLDFVVDF